MERDTVLGHRWAELPLIATVARLLCREVTLENEYLRLENKTLRGQLKGPVRLRNEERRALAQAARGPDTPRRYGLRR